MFAATYLRRQQATLLAIPRAGIYLKDTDLDKTKYDSKQAEDEQLIAYYKNYINDERLTKEERQMYKEKVEKLTAQK
jgi:hypothetical protein